MKEKNELKIRCKYPGKKVAKLSIMLRIREVSLTAFMLKMEGS